MKIKQNIMRVLVVSGIIIILMGMIRAGPTVDGWCFDAPDGTTCNGSIAFYYITNSTGTPYPGNDTYVVGSQYYNSSTGVSFHYTYATNIYAGWTAGDILVVKIDNGAGCTANTSIVLDYTEPQWFPNVTLNCPEPACINLTHGSTYVNENTTLCKGVYNINTTDSILRINASNIVLDCNGAALIGNGKGKGIYNYNHSKVTIKNCIVMNYGNGTYLNNADNNTLFNNTVKSNTDIGLYLYRSHNCTLINNTADSNNVGIHVYQSDYNKIENNKIENNTNHGIYIEDSSCGNTEINRNRVCFNGAATDIYNNGTDNSGGNNTCDTTYKWNDTGTAGCAYRCPVGVETSTNKGAAYLTASNGTIENLMAVNESSFNSTGKPRLTFIYGLFKFNITGITPGSNVTVTIELPGNLPANSQYWKYGPKCPNITEQWYQIPIGSNDGDNIITINLKDGGLGDDNCTEDGKIFDDGAPGSITIDSKLCGGSERDAFSSEDAICAFGNASNETCDIYRCNHTSDYTGYNLSANCANISTVTGVFDDVQVCIGGDEKCTKNSAYDLILDCDRNGYYSDATDAIDYNNTVGGMEGGFYITPEPMSVVLFIFGLSVLYGFLRVRKKSR